MKEILDKNKKNLADPENEKLETIPIMAGPAQ